MERLFRGLEELGLSLSARQIEQFRTYHTQMVQWNQRVNLTAITGREEVQTLHFLDSLTVSVGIPKEVKEGGRIVDLGSGAGFPGLPLKIAFPKIHMTLVESVGKKAAFLVHLVKYLGLEDVDVIQARAEKSATRPGLREGFDAVVSRALAKMPVLVELAIPFARVGGLVIAQKKRDIEEELRAAQGAIELLGGRQKEVRWLRLKDLDEPRALVILEKVAPTPLKYPRRAGIPEKRPLKASVSVS